MKVNKDTGILEISKFGEEVLKVRAADLTVIDERIIQMVELMRHTMYEANGVGLAAPQIGESLQLAVVDITQGEDPEAFTVLINPKIEEIFGSEPGTEGCLSIPGFSMEVDRGTEIRVTAVDLDGNEIEYELEGFEARVFQHEIDHLNGFLILDRVSPLKRQMIKREIKRLERTGKW